MKPFILCVVIFLLALNASGLTLQDCLNQAKERNPELRVTTFNSQILEESVAASRSRYLPRADFQGGYTVQKDPQAVVIAGTPMPTQDASYSFYNLAITETLYDFGRRRTRYQQSKLLKSASEAEWAAQEQQVFLQVVQAYYAVLQAMELQKAAEDETQQMKDHLRLAQALYEEGMVTRNDILQAEVRLVNSEQKGLSAANRVSNSWLLLNYLIGEFPEHRAVLETADVLEPMPEKNDPAPFKDHPQITAAKKVVEAGEESVKETKSAFYPEIFARLAADYTENSHVKEQTIMSATVGLKINLFDGLERRAHVRQAVLQLSQDREKLRLAASQIQLQYDAARNDATVARQRVEVFHKAIEQGEENLRINKDRYKEHVGTATEVIDAQTLLTQTKTEYFSALYDYQVAVARVKQSLGKL